MDVLQQAMAEYPRIVQIRRRIHTHPELGNDLPVTKKLVSSELTRIGLLPEECAGGLLARLDLQKDVTVLLRADMDALPMDEESGLPFSSEVPGTAHTCGHDIHTAVLLGTAAMLADNREQLGCNVVFMFQDDEERAQGCQKMIDAGALKNVDYAFGIHVRPGLETGMIDLSTGQKTASYDRFAVKIRGKGGHGAYPGLAIDPIKIAGRIIVRLDEEVRQKCAGTRGVLTIGIINAGASANSIPDDAFFSGTIRSDSDQERQILKDLLYDVCREYSEKEKAGFELNYDASIPSLYNDPGLAERCIPTLQQILKEKLSLSYSFTNASEDFALVSRSVPTVYFNVGTGPAPDSCGNHNPRVTYDEDAIPYAMSALAGAVLAFQ